MAYRNFEELKVWQEGKSLAADIFKMWESLDNRGYYGLQDQMQRAAISIPSNIAEGSERKSAAEFVRYLFIAKGSTAELRTQLCVFKELTISKGVDVDGFVERTKIMSRMLQKLISSVCSHRNE